jgi:hypothetical protein
MPEPERVLPERRIIEPWMRGILPGIDPVRGHLLRAVEHIDEDLERAIEGLSAEQLWATPRGMTSAGFHAKHLAGSTERLCTYLEGQQLDAGQLAAMAEEGRGEDSAADLIEAVKRALARYERDIRVLSPEHFGDIREIGRNRLQTTAISVAIQIAEHGQRHVGQVISAAKLARAAGA